MKPRHHRLVIPIALAGLLLLVIVAAVGAAMSEPLLRRAGPDARHARSTPTRWCAPWPPVAAGASEPPWRRVELRYVDLKAGRHLQVTAYDATQAHTAQPRGR